MTLLHAILRNTHILMGALGLLSGAAAMLLQKGSVPHRRVGLIFFIAMPLMASCGIILSIVPEVDRLNITAGTLTLYLVLTAWATVRRAPGEIGTLERALAALGAIGALIIASFAIRAMGIPEHAGTIPFFGVFGGILALATVGDVRVIRRGGVGGRARTTRHLWRMCTAMLIATLSLFLGQPQVFPDALRESGLLPVPPLVVLLALMFFVAREKGWTARR